VTAPPSDGARAWRRSRSALLTRRLRGLQVSFCVSRDDVARWRRLAAASRVTPFPQHTSAGASQKVGCHAPTRFLAYSHHDVCQPCALARVAPARPGRAGR
jgi:hypothetical protein